MPSSQSCLVQSMHPASRYSGKRVPEVLCVIRVGLQEVDLPPQVTTNLTSHTSEEGVH